MGKTIAIVGPSPDRAKYGNKAVRAFIQGGWTVYPVNPSVEEVEGLQQEIYDASSTVYSSFS